MAFKSEAQRLKFKELVKNGKMSQAEYDKHHQETPVGIPDRKHPKDNPANPDIEKSYQQVLKRMNRK